MHKNTNGADGMKTVISLCDLTGHMVQPWIEAGYEAFLVDPQHGTTRKDGPVTKFAGTIAEAMPELGRLIRTGNVAMVFGFPPCTHLAVSGAKHFQRKMTDKAWKHYQGPNMWIDAMRIVQECANVGQLSGAPWFLENPKTRISTLWRKPDHKFHPWHYTAYEPGDNYTKETWLWTGGGFIMPPAAMDEELVFTQPDDRIHKCPPGPERANIRSVTPMGFARAVFAANHRPALELAA
jgi:hypothetical protein